jgi:hypothetical protein
MFPISAQQKIKNENHLHVSVVVQSVYICCAGNITQRFKGSSCYCS